MGFSQLDYENRVETAKTAIKQIKEYTNNEKTNTHNHRRNCLYGY